MVEGNHEDHKSIRPPTRGDLVRLCRALNEGGAKYIVVGGMAMIEMGLDRGTMDIDFLVDTTSDNIAKMKHALIDLPDGAAKEVRDTDVAEYNVVRIHDDITVDLMGSACGINYEEATKDIVWRDLDGVRIPFASMELLWKTKQTYREKDALDRSFLKYLASQMREQKPD